MIPAEAWFYFWLALSVIADCLLWCRLAYVANELNDARWLLGSETKLRQHTEEERDAAQRLASMRAMEAEALQMKLTRTEEQFSEFQKSVVELVDRWKPMNSQGDSSD